jgi:molybdopterin converting factor small subunit
VKLRYFAWVRERIGKPEEEVDVPSTVTTVAELVTWLSGRGEEYAYARSIAQRRARNRVFPADDGRLTHSDSPLNALL